jgi:hypothetical protein
MTTIAAFAFLWVANAGSCPVLLLAWWFALGAVGLAGPYIICRFIRDRVPGFPVGGRGYQQ